MSNSVFGAFRDRGVLLDVGMDDIKVHVRNANGARAIGTRGLNGCTCVVILGNPGILLAHIAPFPGDYREDDERDISRISYEHHERYLRVVAEQVRQHASYFPASTTAWGIFSYVKQGNDPPRTIESIIQQVQGHLTGMGYSMRPEFYEQKDVRTIQPPKGEVVAFFNDGGVAQLYVEQNRVWPPNQQTTTPSGNAGPSSTAQASNEWWGYPLAQNAQRQQILSCTVLNKRMDLAVMWQGGQSTPLVYAFEQWRETESSGNILVVRIGDKNYRLEKPQK